MRPEDAARLGAVHRVQSGCPRVAPPGLSPTPERTSVGYAQAINLGLIQGVTELFPVSSLGHSVILPALFGWSNVVAAQSAGESFFLAILVGLHVATAWPWSPSSATSGCAPTDYRPEVVWWEGNNVATAGGEGDAVAPKAQPTTRKMAARPTRSRFAGRSPFIVIGSRCPGRTARRRPARRRR